MPDPPNGICSVSLFLTVALVHLLALAIPGPDFLFVSQTAISRSRGQALAGAAGVALGIGLWAALALLGLHLLLDRLQWLQRALALAGGLYLGWLGWGLVRSALRARTAQASAAPALPVDAPRSLRRGLLINLANPKAVIYFASVFAGLVGPTASAAERGGVLLLVLIESLAWFVLVALLFGLPTLRLAYLRAGRWIDGCAGAVFVTFALELVLRAV